MLLPPVNLNHQLKLMKELKTQFFLLFLTLFVLSCNSAEQHNKHVNGIPETSLNGKNIYLEGIFEPHRMVIVDSLLIITSYQGDYFFHIYNLTNHKLKKEFGRKGKGPDEFLSPRIFNGQRTIKENDSTLLQIFDEGRRTINKINILKILLDDVDAIRSEPIPSQMIKVSDIIFKNDSVIFCIPFDTDKGRFFIYNYNSLKLRITEYQPDLGYKVHENNLYPLYNTATACLIKQNRCIVAMPVLMGELDFFSLNGEYQGSSIIERVDELKYAKHEKIIFQAPNMRYYISDIQTVNERIYVLLTIKLFPDLKNKTTSNIYVFDFDGNPIHKFSLDREINTFCYDSLNNRFIGHCVDELENPFIEYQFESK